MDVRVYNSKIKGEITAPPSKSYAHRLLIGAFLSGEETYVKNTGFSSDVLATVSALESLGADVTRKENGFVICRNNKPDGEIFCYESGTTLRFMLTLSSALGINTKITGEKSLIQRPHEELINTLNSYGANIENFTVNGKLKNGIYKINQSISSQYVSSLLLALPVLDGDSEIVLEGESVSSGYIEITKDVLCLFGINIKETENGYFIKGGQKYKPLKEIDVEGDYSSSANILALGGISGEVCVKGLNENSKQGDREILDILQKFGCEVKVKNSVVHVKKKELVGIETDCKNIPDLVPILSVLGAFAKCKTVLKNIDRLKYKETDRIKSVLEMLTACNIKAEYNGNDLIIYGGTPKQANFCGYNDHRTVMAETVIALSIKGESVIDGIEAVDKSYPEFFSDIKLLGGEVEDVGMAR